MARAPTFSMLVLLERGFGRGDRLQSGWSFAGFGLIFGRAFGLDVVGAEDAIGSEFAFGESLRSIAEGIGKRIFTVVGHL